MEENFQNAYDSYKRITKTFGKMVDKLNLTVSEKVDKKIELQKFDVILQYGLLEIALIDGCFTSDEMHFIENITDYGDFCKYVNHTFDDLNVDWNVLYNINESSLKKLLNACKNGMIDLRKNFIAVFVSIDVVEEDYDYLHDFMEDLFDIMGAVANDDGDFDDDEAEFMKTRKCFLTDMYFVLGEIKEIAENKIAENKLESEQSNSNKSSSHLKDFYVKKN